MDRQPLQQQWFRYSVKRILA